MSRVNNQNKKKALQKKRKKKTNWIAVTWVSLIPLLLLGIISYAVINFLIAPTEDPEEEESSFKLGVTDEGTILVRNRSDADFYGKAVDNGNQAGIDHAREQGIVLPEGTKVEFGGMEDHRLYYVKVLEGEYEGESGYAHFLTVWEQKE